MSRPDAVTANWQPVLEGELLLLRPLQATDWDALFAVASDPLIWELHPAHDRWQEPVFRAFFDEILNSGGATAIIDKASGSIIGSSRWELHDASEGGLAEIGWTFLARSHWGGRYNFDLKRLMVAHALSQVARVEFHVGENNLRSRRAMEKVGARLTDRRETAVRAGVPVLHLIYEFNREEFARSPLAQA